MSVTLQLAKPESLQRTAIAELEFDGNAHRIGPIKWPWAQWFNTIWSVLNYIKIGTGTPEAAVSAPVGTLFLRLDGGAGTTLYVKETGTGNTGWVGK